MAWFSCCLLLLRHSRKRKKKAIGDDCFILSLRRTFERKMYHCLLFRNNQTYSVLCQWGIADTLKQQTTISHTHTNIYNGVWWQEYWNNHTHGNIVSKMSRSMCSKRAFESTYIAMLAMLAMLNHLLMEIIFVFLTCVFSLWSGFHSKSKIIDIQQKCFDISVRTTSFDYCTARTKSIAKFLLFQFYCSIHIIVVISSDHTFFILYMCIHEAI